ncbi:DUF7715 family protein [Streptomyces werraensis]|uniref:DUF7715 family protein n=1 Tax=Streptomyces werraensis TaxID=68284 RepID=UPI003422CE9F
MRLIVTAADETYHRSRTDYSWTKPGEILTIGSDDAFVGIDSRKYTTRGKVVEIVTNRNAVTKQMITLLTAQGWYRTDREKQSAECRKRMLEVFNLARGFELEDEVEVFRGRLRLVPQKSGEGQAA